MSTFRDVLGLLLLLLALLAGSLVWPGNPPALAQTPEVSSEVSQQAGRVEEALGEEAKAAVSDLMNMMSMENSMSTAFKVRVALEKVLTGTGGFWESARATLAAHDPSGDIGWLWYALVVLAGSVVAGLASLSLFERWAQHRFFSAEAASPANRAEKIGYLFGRAIIMTLGLAVFALIGTLFILIFDSGDHGGRVTAFNGLRAVAMILFMRVVLRNILAPDRASHRVLHFSDASAKGLYAWLMTVTGIAYGLIGICSWINALGLDPDAYKLALIGTTFISCLALTLVVVIHRQPISNAIANGQPVAELPGWRRGLVLIWLPLTVAYFFFAFANSAIRILLDLPSATGLVGAPVLALLIALVVYALLVLLVDRWLFPRLDSRKAQQRIREDLARAEIAGGEAIDPAANRAQAEAEAIEHEAARAPYRKLFDHGAALISFVAAAGFLLFAWGIPLNDRRFFAGTLFEVAVIIFVGYMAYRIVQIAIDRQIRLEKGEEESEDGETEIGGKGESRLATLLPIARNFLLITIVVIAAMVALSELGVNIAPIFAGAGVVGLAVGFGAQTLIRDIFSGAFFLIDDAFRKGEYIDLGTVKGTVEKISIRSMQLRHHRGPLNTVPFGEIKHVVNYSRDWAIMKLAFRVTYDTDVDKMRKLIKNFGQELMKDPEYGPKFLQPLKSQGVTAMEDSAMIVRVKFMTRPGDQFELRKVVYAGIRDICAREGIKFAHREVTVHVTQDKNGEEDLTPAQKKAIAGAVLPIVDEAEKKPASA